MITMACGMVVEELEWEDLSHEEIAYFIRLLHHKLNQAE